MKGERLHRSCLFSFTSVTSLRVPQLAPAPLYDTMIRIATKDPPEISIPTLWPSTWRLRLMFLLLKCHTCVRWVFPHCFAWTLWHNKDTPAPQKSRHLPFTAKILKEKDTWHGRDDSALWLYVVTVSISLCAGCSELQWVEVCRIWQTAEHSHHQVP